MKDMTKDELLKELTGAFAWSTMTEQAYNQLRKIVERWFDGEPGPKPTKPPPPPDSEEANDDRP